MKIDVYSSTGTKSGSMDLPASLFEAPINKGLMHLALVRQQSNRRHPIAHVKTRGEVAGTTKKAFQQKGTGRARRGALRSPLLRGGGKTFGPRNNANFQKNMPKKMRRAALFSCLSFSAKNGCVVALESYPETIKTKSLSELLKKMPVELGRRIVIVLPAHHKGVELSARNIPRVRTILAGYLNPEDILQARHVIFLVDAIKVAEETFVKNAAELKEVEEQVELVHKSIKDKKASAKKKSVAKNPKMIKGKKDATAKNPKTSKTKKSSESSESLESSSSSK
ncbi:MAG: 50S ribosomal protein L4 [Candidatus Peribacteraceae bacterium]|nr:50S ribosomal protein L4 [Candidatus Peribacteraceae bacterium]